MKVDIDKLLELEAKATPGPWFSDVNGEREGEGPHGVVWFENDGRTAIFELSYWNQNNEILTASMRNNIRALCEELRAARKVVEAARDMIGDKSIQLKLALKELDENARGEK